MSSAVLDYVRARKPEFANVPDADLTLYLADRKPEFLEVPEFARNVEAFRQMRLNDADTAARTSLAGHVGAAVESGWENFVGAAQAVDRELVAPLTGGTVDQWVSAVPEAVSMTVRDPVGTVGRSISNLGRVLGNDVGNFTRLTGLDPAGPVAKGLQDVGETAPVLAASMGLQRLGVNPALAFGAPPAVQTYGETGDVAATLKAGATGALIPAVAQAGKLGGAALNRALIERNLLSPAANATQKAVEVLGSQGAVQVFMEGLRLPEYAALDPEARREAIYRNLVANTAFLAMDLPTFKRSVPSETLLRMAPAERVAYGLRDAANNPELVDALQRTADELARQATLPDAAQVEGEGPLFRREAPLGEIDLHRETVRQLRMEGVAEQDARALVNGTKTVRDVVESAMFKVRPSRNVGQEQGHAEAWMEGYNLAIWRLNDILGKVPGPRQNTQAPPDSASTVAQQKGMEGTKEEDYRKVAKEWSKTLPDADKDSQRGNNITSSPWDKPFVEGKLTADRYGEDPYVYEDKWIDPRTLLYNTEGMTYEQIVNMPTTQKYIEWYKQGHFGPPISVVFNAPEGRLKSSNRRRVVAAIEAGIDRIPARVEIGKATEVIASRPSGNGPEGLQSPRSPLPAPGVLDAPKSAADAPGRPLDPFPTDQGLGRKVADGEESQAKDAAQMFGLRSSAKTRHQFETAIADAVQAAANGDTIYDPETDVEWLIHHHVTPRGDRVTTVESGGGKSQFQVIQRQNGDRTVSGGKHMAFGRDAVLNSRKQVPAPRQNTQAPPDSASTVAQRFPGPAADAPGRPLDPFPTDQGVGETVEAGGETANDQMLRDRRQNKFRKKAEEIRARRDAWINQTLEQAGERGSLEYVSTTRPDRTVIVSPVPGQPGRWRTTQFDSAGPMGHYEFDSREQAIRAVGGEHHTKQIAGPSYFGTGEYVLKRSKERYNIAADSRPLDPFPTDQGAGETVAPDAEWNVVGMGQMKRPVVKGSDESLLQSPEGADRGAVEVQPNDAGRLPEGPGEARPAAVDAGGVSDAPGGADRGAYNTPPSKALREEATLPEAVKQTVPPLAPKEQKRFLLSEIDKALEAAPMESPTEAAAGLAVLESVSGPPAERAAKLAGLFEQYGIPTSQAERIPIPAKNLEGTDLVSSWPKAKQLDLSEREDLLRRELLRRDLADNQVVIEVPGDGVFTIRNTVAALKDFKERAAKFPTTEARIKAPTTARATPDKVPAAGKLDTANIVRSAATHVSTDTTRGIINQMWSDGSLTVATDGRRLLVIDKGIGGTKAKPELFGPDGKAVTKKFDRAFPDWKQVIPAAPLATFPDLNIERLWTVVRQAAEATDEKHDSMLLVLNRDRSLGVRSAVKDALAYEHNIQPEAEPLAYFNPKYMMDALASLRRLGSDKVSIDYIDDRDPIVIRGDNAKVVLMPMRGAESDRGGRGAAKRILEIMGEVPAAKPAKTKRAAKKSVAGSTRQPQGTFGLPAIPPGVPQATPAGRMTVTMERLVPGFTTVANIEGRLSAIVDVARGIADASPIRSNRLSRRFAGVYSTPSRVVRMWDRLNLPTTAHEVAHALADAIFGTAASRGLRGIPPSVGRELVRLGRNLYGNTRPNAGYAAEGWAELVADYLTTDDIARRAPEATRWLENTVLPAFPEVAQAMREARAEIDVWRGMGARERMRAQTAPHDSKLARLRTELGRYVGREGLVEQFAPFEALSRRFRQVAGRDLAADEDPFLIASARRGQAGSILAYMADEGMIDPSGNRTGGRSLREALAPVTRGLRPDQVLARNQRAADFWSYLWARRAIERWGLDRNPGISLADAQYLRQTLETPDFQLAASRYYQWWDGVLDYLAASSPANRELVARIRAGSKDYVPLARMLDPNQTRPGEEARLSNALRRMRGSSLPVRLLDVQTLLTAESLIARAHRDQVMEAVFRLANQPGMGAMIEEVPRSQVQEVVNIERLRAQLEGMGVDTTGIPADTLLEYYTGADAPGGSDPIVARRVNGEVRWYYVRPDLYAALEGIQPARLPLVADLLLGVPARLFRLGTTGLRPAFSLFTNPVRDIQTFLMQSTAGVNPLRRVAQYFGALGDIVRSGMPGADATPYRDLFDRLGIMAGQPLGGDIGYARREARGLFHGRVFKRVTAPVETLRELLSFSEATPRIAELRLRAQELGWAPGQPLTPAQAIQLTLAAKRVTTDFSASGSYARLWSQAVPFLNASIQGTRGFLRAMRERPVQATLYGVSMFTLPALWTWWHNKDEEWYQALPWRERYLYWNVPDENGQVYQIPRPPEWNNAFAVIPEALMDAAYRDNPDAVKAAFGHIFATTNPFDLPVLARIAWEQARNRVDFFDRPIVPRAQVDLRPGEQVGPYTSWLATSLGKAFPETISPRRVDHLLRGVGGGTASDTLSAIEQMAGLKAGALRSEPSETPVVGRALRRGGQFSAVNRQLADLYDLHYYWQARARNKELAPELAAYARYVDDQIQMVKFGQRVAEQTEDLKARQSLYRDLTRQAESMLTDAKRLKRLPAQQ